MRYTTPLLDWAQQMLCHSLGTSLLPVPTSMLAPFMRVLRLPRHKDFSVSRDTADRLMAELSSDSGAVPVFVVFSGQMWLRISANMYSTKEDYLKLRDVLVKMFL